MIRGYGDKLLFLICKEAVDGENLSKIVSLGCLQSLYSLFAFVEHDSFILDFLVKQNFLGHFLHQLIWVYDPAFQYFSLKHI